MIDLSEYLHEYRPGVKYAILMDNASVHGLLKQMPYDNLDFMMLPANTTAYLQVRACKVCQTLLFISFLAGRYVLQCSVQIKIPT